MLLPISCLIGFNKDFKVLTLLRCMIISPLVRKLGWTDKRKIPRKTQNLQHFHIIHHTCENKAKITELSLTGDNVKKRIYAVYIQCWTYVYMGG